MLVRDLIALLEDLPEKAEVLIGILDDEWNPPGGIFVPVEELSHFEDDNTVQLSAYADIGAWEDGEPEDEDEDAD